MATFDPYAIDASAGSPAYSAQETRVLSVVPGMIGAGVALGCRSGVRQSGSTTDLLVQAQTSPNMTVKVNPGIAVIQSAISTTAGAYVWALDTVTNATIAASHATLDRIDLITVRVRDANVDTSGQRDGGIVVITGTAGAGTPALPTDATYFTLASVSVVHSVTSITSASITDTRTFTAALGGTIPATSTNRPTGISNGARMWETDTSLFYSRIAAGWRRDEVIIYKSANTSYTSTTTLATDPDLQFSGEANAVYAYDLNVGWSAASGGPGYKAALLFPTGTLGDYSYTFLTTGGSPVAGWMQAVASDTAMPTGVSGATIGGTRVTGIVRFSSTAGTFAWRAAQGTSSATAVQTLLGSTLRYRQIG